MTDTQALLRQLVESGECPIHLPDWLAQPPTPIPASLSFDRIEGMLLGLAIGDALGNTTEADDGAVYHILDETRRIWWDGPAPVPSPGQESELGNRS